MSFPAFSPMDLPTGLVFHPPQILDYACQQRFFFPYSVHLVIPARRRWKPEDLKFKVILFSVGASLGYMRPVSKHKKKDYSRTCFILPQLLKTSKRTSVEIGGEDMVSLL